MKDVEKSYCNAYVAVFEFEPRIANASKPVNSQATSLALPIDITLPEYLERLLAELAQV